MVGQVIEHPWIVFNRGVLSKKSQNLQFGRDPQAWKRKGGGCGRYSRTPVGMTCETVMYCLIVWGLPFRIL